MASCTYHSILGRNRHFSCLVRNQGRPNAIYHFKTVFLKSTGTGNLLCQSGIGMRG